MNIGIRLHDTLPGTPEERLDAVRQQGFSCIHLAMQKVIPGFKMQDAPELLTRELAGKVRSALEDRGIGCAVLGCYLKLADPDDASNLRSASVLCGLDGRRMRGDGDPAGARCRRGR